MPGKTPVHPLLTDTLEYLIAYRTDQRAAEIRVAKDRLHDANVRVVSIEKKLVPDYKKELEQKLKLREADLTAHEETRPKAVAKPPEGGEDAVKGAREIAAIDTGIVELNQKISDAQTESAALSKSTEDLRQARQTIARQVKAVTALKTKYGKLLEAEGIAFEEIVAVQESYTRLDNVIRTKEVRLRELEELLRDAAHIAALGLGPEETRVAENKSLFCERSALENKRKEITDKLDKPNRLYQNRPVRLSLAASSMRFPRKGESKWQTFTNLGTSSHTLVYTASRTTPLIRKNMK